MKKYLLVTLVIALALTLTACPEPEPIHTHTWGAWQTNATQHWKECTANDGEEYGRANHTGDPCTVCGYETPHTHDAGTWITTQQPTCSEAGTKELRCTVDNFVLDTGTIPALGHTWEWVETTPATIEADGLETETCKTCGAINGTRPITKLVLLCTCAPKEHYLPCDCGGTDCTCAVIPRGYIAEKDTNAQIPIYQKITNNEKAIAATDNIIYEWDNYMDDIDLRALKGKLQEVWIIQTATDQSNCYDYEVVGNKAILKIQYNLGEWYFSEVFWHFATQVLPNLNTATITQNTTPNLAFDGTVTIKTSDPYTASDWNAVVEKVVAALNRGYGKNMADPEGIINKTVFTNVFAGIAEVIVIVSKSASHNVEVKSVDYTNLYLKESSLDTVDIQPAVWAMSDGANYQANATPVKDMVFLA